MGTGDLIPTSGKFQDPENGSALWDELEATAYERIITSQHDFIRFMQRLYVPDDDILFPPEDGWPEITKEAYYMLDKSEKAIEVLRNMAYIQDSLNSFPREILDGTVLYDYRDPDLVDEFASGEPKGLMFGADPPDGPAPNDVVGLTTGGNGRAIILLDCRYGIVRWINCGEGHTWFGIQTKGNPSNEHDGDWGGETAWPVEEFFEYVMAKFTNLEQLTFNQSRLIDKELHSGEPVYDFDFFKEVYQRHGWPGADYNKEACMKELEDHCKKNCIN